MTQCTAKPLAFSSLSRRRVEADFDGGHLTSDAGALLLREVDRRLGLTERLAACLTDRRDPGATTHTVPAMLRQRIFGIALGYEDLNDHHTLRNDPLMKVLAERPPEEAQPLASAAYVLVETLRREGLAGTQMARAQAGTIRTRLLKIGARVRVSVRRVVLHLSSGYPLQDLFRRVLARLRRLPRLPRAPGHRPTAHAPAAAHPACGFR